MSKKGIVEVEGRNVESLYGDEKLMAEIEEKAKSKDRQDVIESLRLFEKFWEKLPNGPARDFIYNMMENEDTQIKEKAEGVYSNTIKEMDDKVGKSLRYVSKSLSASVLQIQSRMRNLSIAFDIPKITESIKTIYKVTEMVRLSQLSIVESLRPIIEQQQLYARMLSEALVPQIKFWQWWVEQNRIIFDTYSKFWLAFQEQYKITKQEAIQILSKYKWFITPSLPINFVFDVVEIGRRPSNQRKAINRLFVDYFSSDDFKNLENLVNGWEQNEIFKPRMKIFRDCVFAMKNANEEYNPANFVLPTLIAQIDGIRIDFMNKNGLSFWTQDKAWKTFFKDKTSNQDLLDLANDIFLDILFQKSQPGKPLDISSTFNRHKIMHGEYVRYGRIDNTIRAFLILDFLATLSE